MQVLGYCWVSVHHRHAYMYAQESDFVLFVLINKCHTDTDNDTVTKSKSKNNYNKCSCRFVSPVQRDREKVYHNLECTRAEDR